VHDPADVAEAAVEDEVGRRVGGGTAVARDRLAAPELDDDHRLRAEVVVRDSARLDREHAGVAVDGAHVPEREHDEPGAHERPVRLGDALSQLGVRAHAQSPRARW
jgi:hypothetical protein